MKRALITLIAAFATAAALIAAAPDARAASPTYISDGAWAGYVTINSSTLYSDAVSFDVTITGKVGRMPVNPFYFVAKSASGYRYNDPDYRADTALTSGYLPPGERVRATVTLKVTHDAPTALIYEYSGEQLAKWTLTWKKSKPKPPQRPFGPLS